MADEKDPDMKGLILGFLIPPGRERGAGVKTLPPPLPGARMTRQSASLESGRQIACPAPVVTIQLSKSNMSLTSVSDPTPPTGTGTIGITLTPFPTRPAILVIVSTRIGAYVFSPFLARWDMEPIKIRLPEGRLPCGLQYRLNLSYSRFSNSFSSQSSTLMITAHLPSSVGGRTGGKDWSVSKMTMGSPLPRLSDREWGQAQERQPIGSSLPIGGINTVADTFRLASGR